MGVIGYIFYVTGVIAWILILNFLALCVSAYMPLRVRLFLRDTWFVIKCTLTPYVTRWRESIAQFKNSSYPKRQAFLIAERIIEFRYKLLNHKQK